MKKKEWKSGDCLPPELINALMDLSYNKNADEVGHLPLPEDYYDKIQTYKTVGGSVDLSNAEGSVVLVEHEGSSTSLQPVTINIHLISQPKIIFFVPRGADYPVTLFVPVDTGHSRPFKISGGNAAILSWFSYGSQRAWRLYELPKSPIYTPTAHDFTEHTGSDSVALSPLDSFIDIVSSGKIKVKQGIVDFTVGFTVDHREQQFAGTLRIRVFDEVSEKIVITKALYIPASSTLPDYLLNFRFSFSTETYAQYVIQAGFSTQGGTVSIGNVNVSGSWIDQ